MHKFHIYAFYFLPNPSVPATSIVLSSLLVFDLSKNKTKHVLFPERRFMLAAVAKTDAGLLFLCFAYGQR